MGKMKELAIKLANDSHGSWSAAQQSDMLDDEYREQQFKNNKTKKK